jgi:hypothetical protein
MSDPAMRPWTYEEALTYLGRFFRPKRENLGLGEERAVGILMMTQACSRGVALGPSQRLSSFSELLETWEWSYLATPDSQWFPCGVVL